MAGREIKCSSSNDQKIKLQNGIKLRLNEKIKGYLDLLFYHSSSSHSSSSPSSHSSSSSNIMSFFTSAINRFILSFSRRGLRIQVRHLSLKRIAAFGIPRFFCLVFCTIFLMNTNYLWETRVTVFKEKFHRK